MKEKIKILRQETGGGLMDCKKALEKAGGDMEKAKQLVKERLQSNTLIIETRPVQNEGAVFNYTHLTKKVSATVVLKCETDFVARNEVFQALGNDIALHVVACQPSTIEELLSQPFVKNDTITIKEYVDQTIGKIRENIVISQFQRFEV